LYLTSKEEERGGGFFVSPLGSGGLKTGQGEKEGGARTKEEKGGGNLTWGCFVFFFRATCLGPLMKN